MREQTYAEKLKSPLWQKKRLEIMNRDDFICKKCGDTKTQLHVHHLEYTAKYPWDESDENLISLCSECHSAIEEYKKNNLNIFSLFKHKINDNKRLIVIKSEQGVDVWIIDTGEDKWHGFRFNADLKKKLFCLLDDNGRLDKIA